MRIFCRRRQPTTLSLWTTSRMLQSLSDMKKNDYIPRPIDTFGVHLPKELDDLVETLARNVHDVWAAGRIAEGWTWGPVRDDALKQHPCLVPYEELPDSEREYDRHTAIETIKLILVQGYRIS